MNRRARLGEPERLDVADIAPRPAPGGPSPDALRAAAEAEGWGGEAPAGRGAARQPYRRRSRRTERISARVTPEARRRFYALAEENDWEAGETLERIIAAFCADDS